MGSACSVSAWPNRAGRVKQAFMKMKMLCKSFHSNCVTNMYINKRRMYVHLLLSVRTGKGQRVKSIPKALIFKNNKVNWEVQPVWGCTSLYTAVSKISNTTLQTIDVYPVYPTQGGGGSQSCCPDMARWPSSPEETKNTPKMKPNKLNCGCPPVWDSGGNKK